MKAILAGVALVAVSTIPAFADYYVIQEPTSHRCRIVEERPSGPSIGVVIGERGFGVRTEAESHMRTVEVCREGTSGRGGGAVIKEERR